MGTSGKEAKKKGADTFPFAFTGSLRMKTRHSHTGWDVHTV